MVTFSLVTSTLIPIPQNDFGSFQAFRCLIFQKLFTSPSTTNGIIGFHETPTGNSTAELLGGNPILQDEESRDSGIFLSDESTCNVSTPVARKLSFKAFFTSPEFDKEFKPFNSFFTSPDTTPKAAGLCKTRRTLFGHSETLSSDTQPVDYFTTPVPITSAVGQSAKRRLSDHEEDDHTPVKPNKKIRTDATEVRDSIKEALNKQMSCDNLVGDFSRGHRLETVVGKHQDLKSISTNTVADLISGKINVQGDFQIVHSRYPYEYEGGHIKGAANMHTQDQINGFLQGKFNDPSNKNTILIFHCEFSSERGPKRARFLRSRDRELNSEYYPSLCFPEIYIMDGGYKSFFQDHPHLCTPQGYTPMLKVGHREDLKKFRSKSKSWTAGFRPKNRHVRSELGKLELKY